MLDVLDAQSLIPDSDSSALRKQLASYSPVRRDNLNYRQKRDRIAGKLLQKDGELDGAICKYIHSLEGDLGGFYGRDQVVREILELSNRSEVAGKIDTLF